ncbi:unnamed protein product [Caenorhabditis sp. 36 PRJEB53466]|nr:unnamed protein product [Caenorhabditis sp. 36 PRJEB53466]
MSNTTNVFNEYGGTARPPDRDEPPEGVKAAILVEFESEDDPVMENGSKLLGAQSEPFNYLKTATSVDFEKLCGIHEELPEQKPQGFDEVRSLKKMLFDVNLAALELETVVAKSTERMVAGVDGTPTFEPPTRVEPLQAERNLKKIGQDRLVEAPNDPDTDEEMARNEKIVEEIREWQMREDGMKGPHPRYDKELLHAMTEKYQIANCLMLARREKALKRKLRQLKGLAPMEPYELDEVEALALQTHSEWEPSEDELSEHEYAKIVGEVQSRVEKRFIARRLTNFRRFKAYVEKLDEKRRETYMPEPPVTVLEADAINGLWVTGMDAEEPKPEIAATPCEEAWIVNDYLNERARVKCWRAWKAFERKSHAEFNARRVRMLEEKGVDIGEYDVEETRERFVPPVFPRLSRCLCDPTKEICENGGFVVNEEDAIPTDDSDYKILEEKEPFKKFIEPVRRTHRTRTQDEFMFVVSDEEFFSDTKSEVTLPSADEDELAALDRPTYKLTDSDRPDELAEFMKTKRAAEEYREWREHRPRRRKVTRPWPIVEKVPVGPPVNALELPLIGEEMDVRRLNFDSDSSVDSNNGLKKKVFRKRTVKVRRAKKVTEQKPVEQVKVAVVDEEQMPLIPAEATPPATDCSEESNWTDASAEPLEMAFPDSWTEQEGHFLYVPTADSTTSEGGDYEPCTTFLEHFEMKLDAYKQDKADNHAEETGDHVEKHQPREVIEMSESGEEIESEEEIADDEKTPLEPVPRRDRRRGFMASLSEKWFGVIGVALLLSCLITVSEGVGISDLVDYRARRAGENAAATSKNFSQLAAETLIVAQVMNVIYLQNTLSKNASFAKMIAEEGGGFRNMSIIETLQKVNLEKDLKEVKKIGKLYFKGSSNETVATLIELTAGAGNRPQILPPNVVLKAISLVKDATLPPLDPESLNNMHQALEAFYTRKTPFSGLDDFLAALRGVDAHFDSVNEWTSTLGNFTCTELRKAGEQSNSTLKAFVKAVNESETYVDELMRLQKDFGEWRALAAVLDSSFDKTKNEGLLKTVTALSAFLKTAKIPSGTHHLIAFPNGLADWYLLLSDLKAPWLKDVLNNGNNLTALMKGILPVDHVAVGVELVRISWKAPMNLRMAMELEDDEELLRGLNNISVTKGSSVLASMERLLKLMEPRVTVGKFSNSSAIHTLDKHLKQIAGIVTFCDDVDALKGNLAAINKASWDELYTRLSNEANDSMALKGLRKDNYFNQCHRNTAQLAKEAQRLLGIVEEWKNMANKLQAVSNSIFEGAKWVILVKTTHDKFVSNVHKASEDVKLVTEVLKLAKGKIEWRRKREAGVDANLRLVEGIKNLVNATDYTETSPPPEAEHLKKLAVDQKTVAQLYYSSQMLATFANFVSNPKEVQFIKDNAKAVDVYLKTLPAGRHEGWTNAAEVVAAVNSLEKQIKALMEKSSGWKTESLTDLNQFFDALDAVVIPPLLLNANFIGTLLNVSRDVLNDTSNSVERLAYYAAYNLDMKYARMRTKGALPPFVDEAEPFLDEFFGMFNGSSIYPAMVSPVLFITLCIWLCCGKCVTYGYVTKWKNRRRWERMQEKLVKIETTKVLRKKDKTTTTEEAQEPTKDVQFARSTPETPKKSEVKVIKMENEQTREGAEAGGDWLQFCWHDAPIDDDGDELAKEEESHWTWIPFSDTKKDDAYPPRSFGSGDLRSIGTDTLSTQSASTVYMDDNVSDVTADSDYDRDGAFETDYHEVRDFWKHRAMPFWAKTHILRHRGFLSQQHYEQWHRRAQVYKLELEERIAKAEAKVRHLKIIEMNEKWQHYFDRTKAEIKLKNIAYKMRDQEMLAKQEVEQAKYEAEKAKRTPEENVMKYVSESYHKDPDAELMNVKYVWPSIDAIDNYILSERHDYWEHLYRNHSHRFTHDWCRVRFSTDSFDDCDFYDAGYVHPYKTLYEKVLHKYTNKIIEASAPMFKCTIGLLWHWIYENNVPFMVVLNQFLERHIMVCPVWYPLRVGERLRCHRNQYREYEIVCTSCVAVYKRNGIERTFKVTLIHNKQRIKTKKFRMLKMLDWDQDHMPLDWMHYVDICERINEYSKLAPTVVMSLHGSGRAMTLILALMAAILCRLDDDISIHAMVHGGRQTKRCAIVVENQIYIWRMIHYELLFRWFPKVGELYRLNMDVRAEIWEDCLVGILEEDWAREAAIWPFNYDWEVSRYRRFHFMVEYLRHRNQEKRNIAKLARKEQDVFEARTKSEQMDERSPYRNGVAIRRKPLRVGDAPRDKNRPKRKYLEKEKKRADEKMFARLTVDPLVGSGPIDGRYEWVRPSEVLARVGKGAERPDVWKWSQAKK